MLENSRTQQSSTREKLVALLESHGVLPTAQRVRIAQVLFAGHEHLSAEQIHHRVNQSANEVSRATVYNTLGLLARKGLVREVIVDPTRVFYDTNSAPHHHFYDADNGELTDIEAGHVDLGPLPRLPEGTELEGVELVIRIRRSGKPPS